MRGLLNRVSQNVVAGAVVVMLAMPAQAQPQDREGFAPKLIKAVKRLVVRTFGDGVIVPRP
jgi:hypothetical protein